MIIELTRDKKVIIDDEDYELSKYNWYAVKCGNVGDYWYAVRTILSSGNKKMYLHKQIMGGNGIVDFINGNTLDCRKSNLRITNRSNDSKNRFAYGKSQYLGVSLHTVRSKYVNKKGEEKIYHSTSWVAKIKIDGKDTHLGRFKNEIEAAKKYDEYAKKHHKEFARLNFQL